MDNRRGPQDNQTCKNKSIKKVYLIAVIAASFVGAAAENPSRDAAQRELYSAHWPRAVDLYRDILRDDPSWGAGWDSLVRALIEARRAGEAYEAADRALKSAPETAGAYTAQGRALWRQGQLAQAEASFRKASSLDAKNPYALEGLARVFRTVAKFATAERLATSAYQAAPDDPGLVLAWANTLKGAAHVEALRRALSIYDPATEEAKRLRAHIAADIALGDPHTRTLASPYRSYELNLVDIFENPKYPHGVGLHVKFNDSYQGTLLLDSGAGGISLSRKAAKKAGFETLEEEGGDVRGIGDKEPASEFRNLASEVRIGDLVVQNCPVSIFDTAKDSSHDGLIGTDFFSKFLVELDWPHKKLRLSPYPGLTAPPDGVHDSDDRLPPGFLRIFYFGHLVIPTFINDGPARLFIIDSGSSTNLINVTAARDITKVHHDNYTNVQGVQGRVKEVSRADRVRLRFSTFSQDNADMVALDLSRMSDDMGMEMGGLLGMPVLRNLAMTIDYRNAAIHFEFEPR
jgi:tetratricopeptide (TPR) repeat protein